jgi:hypothetical protein
MYYKIRFIMHLINNQTIFNYSLQTDNKFTFMKHNLLKRTALLITLALLINSCQNEEYSSLNQSSNTTSNSEKPEVSFESINFNENGKLKLKFAEAFSNALIANKDLRRLVKEEALKKFDKDYDVLYTSVKNYSLTPINYDGKSKNKTSKNLLQKSANALTLREALLPFFNSEAELNEIEQKLPLLTIFVPELPLGYFSAETWDINDEAQIPDVALRLNNTNDIPVISKEGEKYVIEAELTPGFPIVVIKENERVVLYDKITSKKSNTSQLLKGSNGLEFILLDDNFNPNLNSKKNTKKISGNNVDQFLINSYNVWEGYAPGGWQRDNIYYGLTPTISSGKVTGKYREYITSFALKGDPNSAYLTISGHNGDPAKVTDYRLNTSSGWTDGQFEFRAYCYFGAAGATSGTDPKSGSSTIKRFYFNPADLFELKYEAYTRFKWPVKKTYIRTTVIGIKTINFLDPKYNLSPELETWDLSRFSNEWKFSFEEVDVPTEVTQTISLNQKYNTNFSVDITTGEKTKQGYKLGISAEETRSTGYSIKFTTQSDFLGDVFVPFYDNVVNKNPITGEFYTRSYSTGAIQFELRPIQVQW